MVATRQPSQRSEERFVRHDSGAHRLFYRDAAISVSDRWLTVLGRRFAVSELHGLRTVREPQAGNGVVIMIGVAGIAVASVFALAANVASTATIVAAPLLAALLVGAALATLRLRRRH